jgi:hypothetical protein
MFECPLYLDEGRKALEEIIRKPFATVNSPTILRRGNYTLAAWVEVVKVGLVLTVQPEGKSQWSMLIWWVLFRRSSESKAWLFGTRTPWIQPGDIGASESVSRTASAVRLELMQLLPAFGRYGPADNRRAIDCEVDDVHAPVS